MKPSKIAVLALILVGVMCMLGCSFMVTESAKVDSSVDALMKLDDASLSPACRVGLAEGWTAGATVSPDIKSVIETLKGTVEVASDTEYKACKNWAAWKVFKLRAGKAKADSMLTSIVADMTSLKAVINALKIDKPKGGEITTFPDTPMNRDTRTYVINPVKE